MPNRTIYVSEDDQPLYRRAQELAGDNLSAAISTALKRFVELEEGRLAGFDEITVKVGTGGARRKVRFSGLLLGEWMRASGERVETVRVYRGRGGRFAIHTEHSPEYQMRDAQGNPLTGWRAWTGIGMAAGGGKPAEGKLDVVDTLDDLRERIPPELYDMVAESAEQPTVEEIQI